MTEAELKQKEADRAYFHSHRDKNKDGMIDKVKNIYFRDVTVYYQRHAIMHSFGSYVYCTNSVISIFGA